MKQIKEMASEKDSEFKVCLVGYCLPIHACLLTQHCIH